jgi:hypothetical protein
MFWFRFLLALWVPDSYNNMSRMISSIKKCKRIWDVGGLETYASFNNHNILF